MGPIEVVFLAILVIFGAVGVVRGYVRELGVTLMLLLGLLVLLLLEDRFDAQLDRLWLEIAGPDLADQAVARAIVFCSFLTIIAFISYEGITLSFTGTGQNAVFSLGAGLLNGYLYAGSLWYYLGMADWPLVEAKEPFSSFYHFAWELLPPNVLKWEYLIALVTFMLIMRVWK
jgi:uncharacterized membrane protein required for colicin V production